MTLSSIVLSAVQIQYKDGLCAKRAYYQSIGWKITDGYKQERKQGENIWVYYYYAIRFISVRQNSNKQCLKKWEYFRINILHVGLLHDIYFCPHSYRVLRPNNTEISDYICSSVQTMFSYVANNIKLRPKYPLPRLVGLQTLSEISLAVYK